VKVKWSDRNRTEVVLHYRVGMAKTM
jgi:hypothetical protein